MILDKSLVLDDAHAVSATTASDSYVDTLAAGTAYNEDLYVQFLIDTAFTFSTANGTLQLVLQSAADAAFGTMGLSMTLSNTGTATHLAAQKCFQAKLIPGLSRYLRAYYTVTGTLVSTGKIDCRLVKDIDITMDLIL